MIFPPELVDWPSDRVAVPLWRVAASTNRSRVARSRALVGAAKLRSGRRCSSLAVRARLGEASTEMTGDTL